MVFTMKNNDQRLFKDVATVFETLENDQQALERVNHKQTILPQSVSIIKAKKKFVLPEFVEELLTLGGMVVFAGFAIFGTASGMLQ
jgi:hypothetical protein